VIHQDLVAAAAADGRIWGLDLATGAVRWTIPGLDGPFDGIITRVDQEQRGLAIVGDRLIAGSLTGYLTAYDLTTRRQVWQLQQGWLGSLSWRDYTHANGVAYVPFISGFLHAVDTATGTIRWRTRDYRQGLAWPVLIADDRVIATGASGVWAFRAARPADAPDPGGEGR
jgi:outer membrane protein assembly factor BamB